MQVNSNTEGTYCYIFMATVVTRTRHNVALACIADLVALVWNSVLWRAAAVIPYSQYWRISYFTWNVKTRRLQERSMIRHRKWLLGQLSVSWIVLWSAFVTRFASTAYPPSHPDRTWDSVCGGCTPALELTNKHSLPFERNLNTPQRQGWAVLCSNPGTEEFCSFL